MSDTPSELSACDEGLPLLGVTREFDFGQFIELYDSSPIDPQKPAEYELARIVIKPTSTLAADRDAVSSSQSLISSPFDQPELVASVGEAEVHLFSLTEQGPGAKAAVVDVRVENGSLFLESGGITYQGRRYKFPLDASTREALSKGFSVTAFASASEGDVDLGPRPVRVTLVPEDVAIDAEDLPRILAGGRVPSSLGEIKPFLDSGGIRALLAGKAVVTHGTTSEGRVVPLHLEPAMVRSALLSDRFDIFDLAEFLSSPTVLGAQGEEVPLDLEPGHIRQLIDLGRTEVHLDDVDVQLDLVTDPNRQDLKEYEEFVRGGAWWPQRRTRSVKSRSLSWQEIENLVIKHPFEKYFANPSSSNNGLRVLPGASLVDGPSTQQLNSLISRVQPRLPTGSGLPVAVFVPWKQTWELKGFSRGNLLQSIALAPQEELTLQVFSWERRERSLEQSSETDVEQSTDISNSTRDTEDVFKEMIAKRDFSWQLSGSLDASYSN
ncbi:MAG: hypothetical protein AB7O65_14040, partial [Candidatus Korobacteraceae bacterium]